jgi:plastocyanin
MPFAPILIHLTFVFIAVLGCGVKLVQTVRRESPHAPGWLTPGLTAMTGVAVGMLLLGAIAQPSTASATTSKAGTETVHLTGSAFAPNIVALHKGDTLTIVDDVPVPHILTNGTWSADNKPVPGVEPGAPLVNNVKLNNITVTVGPFTTSGTYHIYCTVHPGMSLTILVQ